MTFSFSTVGRILLLLALGSSVGAQAQPASSADAYPSRPIRLFIGQAAGGAVDTVARMVSERLSASLGQPVIVENKPGAGGMLAAEALARANPDGYTLGLLDVGPLAVNPVLQKKVSYDVTKDFRYIGTVARIPLVLVANPALEVNSLADLTRYAKSHPGALSYASAGVGSPPHLAFEMYKQRAGIFVTHLPYRGGAPALADVVAGHVQLTFIDTNLGSQYLKSGKVKALAVGTLQRSVLMPNVPTLDESGLKGFESAPWVGVVGPAAMPAPVVARLSAAVNALMANEEFKSRILAIGFAPFASDSDAFSTLVRKELVAYRTLATEQNIKLED